MLRYVPEYSGYTGKRYVLQYSDYTGRGMYYNAAGRRSIRYVNREGI